jgi:hypothetical protein
MDGVFGIAVEKSFFGKSSSEKDRRLYFHALASDAEYSVPISVLSNRTAWLNNGNSFSSAFEIVGTRGSQSAASSLDTNGNLFFSLNNINAIACWDISKQTFSPRTLTILVRDDEKLQFPSGMKVIRNTDGEEELWVVTNRFQVCKTLFYTFLIQYSTCFFIRKLWQELGTILKSTSEFKLKGLVNF